MLLLFVVFAAVAVAQKACIPPNPSLNLPSCTNKCLRTMSSGCITNVCPCGDDLRAWCESKGSISGPPEWFSMWGQCLYDDCADDGDLADLMTIFTAQCEGTKGGPLTNDTVPYPLGQYMPTTTFQSTVTVTPTAMAGSGAPSVSQSTTSPVVTDTGKSSSDPASTTNVSSSSQATEADSSTASSEEDPKPGLSTAAIVGIAVGGTVLFGLIVGVAYFLLRRRKRNKTARPSSPPAYEPTKVVYEKPELDGQMLEHQYSEVGTGTPVEYAELDAGTPIQSPMLRAHEGSVRVV